VAAKRRGNASPLSRTSSSAKVFIAPSAARRLDDKVLDVRVSEDQDRIQFVIEPQPQVRPKLRPVAAMTLASVVREAHRGLVAAA
jgi:hypothetical protein